MVLNKGLPPHPLYTRFEEEVEKYWGRRCGAHSEIGELKSVLVHKPGNELKAIDDEMSWLWIGVPDIARCQAEHGAMVETLRREGVEVHFLEKPIDGKAKMYFMRDQAVVIRGGALISRMAMEIRRGEEKPVMERLVELGVPILHTVHGTGTLEGGNIMFLNTETALIGTGLRTNEEGFRQAADVLKNAGTEEVIPVPIPGYLDTFPAGYVHIDACFNVVDRDLCLVYPEGLPYSFIEFIRSKELNLIEVSRKEALNFGTNLLVLKPRKVLAAAGNDVTRKMMEKEGVEVVETKVDELMKGGGSIRCMTMPLIREELQQTSES